METIIYLYRWKHPIQQNELNVQKEQALHLQKLMVREEFDMRDYKLVKLGMSETLLQICEENGIRESGRRTKETGGFFARRCRKKRRMQEKLLLEELEEMLSAESEIGGIVCEEIIAYFAGREFNGYFQADYVRHMLRYGTELLSHLVILGQTACVPELVYESIRHVKSMKWILPKRQFRVEQQEMVDILYEEYGLAVEVKLLEERESYMQVYPICLHPSLVLDFSEADRIATADVPRGSIWLDMAASEEKRRRIEDRNTGIRYFSLKKEWKQPQKALNHLDTTSKNGYNT
ncbi:MAG: hypothetical protein E7291_09710 [Lachnospiraceae bacterium]|nr:hypothetical protein [Lachnospiraceae bacterium]